MVWFSSLLVVLVDEGREGGETDRRGQTCTPYRGEAECLGRVGLGVDGVSLIVAPTSRVIKLEGWVLWCVRLTARGGQSSGHIPLPDCRKRRALPNHQSIARSSWEHPAAESDHPGAPRATDTATLGGQVGCVADAGMRCSQGRR